MLTPGPIGWLRFRHTLAELRGGKFEHTINVRREQAPPPVAGANADYVVVDEEDLRRTKAAITTRSWRAGETAGWSAAWAGRRSPQTGTRSAGVRLPQKGEEDAAPQTGAESNGTSGRGTPLPKPEGSNGNFAGED